MATFMTSATLAAGKWHVHVGINWDNAVGGNILQAQVAEGTATATFVGKTAAELASTASQVRTDDEMDFIATVSVAGTLVFQAVTNTTTDTPKIFITTDSSAGTPTGYTAVRIS